MPTVAGAAGEGKEWAGALTDCCGGSVPWPGTLGTALSACAIWKTCRFPAFALDLEMLFSGANVLSCEADRAALSPDVPEVLWPVAGGWLLSQPRKTLFKVQKLSHPKQWEGLSEEDRERKLDLTQDLPVVQ